MQSQHADIIHDIVRYAHCGITDYSHGEISPPTTVFNAIINPARTAIKNHGPFM